MKSGKVTLSLSGATEQNNIIYGITKRWNLIVAIDKERESVRVLSTVPEWCDVQDFIDIIYWNNYLVLIPLLSNKIWFYSLAQDIWNSIEIPDCVTNSGNGNFCIGYVKVDYLYLIGNCYPGVLKVDLKEKKIVKKIPAYEKVLNQQAEKKDGFTFFDYVVVHQKIYIASGVSNRVHIINLEDDTCYDVIVGRENSTYVGIAYDGNDFWLAARHGGEITKWDGGDSAVIMHAGKENDICRYIGIFKAGKYIVADAIESKYTVCVDYNSNSVVEKKINIPSTRRLLSNTEIWAEDQMFRIADKSTLEIVKSFAVAVDVETMINFLGDEVHNILIKSGAVAEETLFDLQDYIECI